VWRALASLPPRSRLVVTRLLARFGFSEAPSASPPARTGWSGWSAGRRWWSGTTGRCRRD